MTDILKCCNPKPVKAKRAIDEVSVPDVDGNEAKDGVKEENDHSAKKIKVDDGVEERPGAAVKDEADKLELEEDESFAEVKEEDVKPVKHEIDVDSGNVEAEEDEKPVVKAEE